MDKNKLNLRNVVAIAICLAGMTTLLSCDKEKIIEIDDEKFCLYANIEDFHKATPFINEYLRSLPKKWSDERKVRALVDCLDSKSCITVVDFDIMPNWCWTPPVQFATFVYIKILLDDNGVEKEMMLDVGREVESNSFIVIRSLELTSE